MSPLFEGPDNRGLHNLCNRQSFKLKHWHFWGVVLYSSMDLTHSSFCCTASYEPCGALTGRMEAIVV